MCRYCSRFSDYAHDLGLISRLGWLGLRSLHSTFQDCREFQGELFGICNLFRDLSDKLFTSEIIELHEQQGAEHGNRESAKLDLTELQMCFLPQKGKTKTSTEVSENSKPKDASRKTVKPVLEDLGECFYLWSTLKYLC